MRATSARARPRRRPALVCMSRQLHTCFCRNSWPPRSGRPSGGSALFVDLGAGRAVRGAPSLNGLIRMKCATGRAGEGARAGPEVGERGRRRRRAPIRCAPGPPGPASLAWLRGQPEEACQVAVECPLARARLVAIAAGAPLPRGRAHLRRPAARRPEPSAADKQPPAGRPAPRARAARLAHLARARWRRQPNWPRGARSTGKPGRVLGLACGPASRRDDGRRWAACPSCRGPNQRAASDAVSIC